MIIIPAIDIIDGKVVRLSTGDFSTKKEYYNDPVDAAKLFNAAGLQRLHLVDLDGARNRKPQNLKVLYRIARATNLQIDFGGGITCKNDVKAIFDTGASQCTIGSLAVNNKELLQQWLNEFGSGKFLIGADVLDEEIKISGWLKETGISIFDFLQNMLEIGAEEVFCTDISMDGKLNGPSLNLYKRILDKFPGLKLIASGGVSGMQDLYRLQNAGCYGAIVGKAIYEEKISPEQLSNFENAC